MSTVVLIHLTQARDPRENKHTKSLSLDIYCKSGEINSSILLIRVA